MMMRFGAVLLLLLVSPVACKNMDFVMDGIYVGNQAAAGDLDMLRANQVDAVLNVAWDLDIRYPAGEYVGDLSAHNEHLSMQYHKAGMVDGPGNTVSSMAAAVLMLDQLKSARDMGPKDKSTFFNPVRRILVHCHTGRSRSVTTVALYLFYKHPEQFKTFNDAIDFVKLKRGNHEPDQPSAAMRLLGNTLASVNLLSSALLPHSPQECGNFFPANDPSVFYPIQRLASVIPYSVSVPRPEGGDYTYDINICSPVACSGSHLPGSILHGACQSWDEGGTHQRSLGLLGSAKVTPSLGGKGFTLTYDDGDTCSGNVNRSVIVEVVCSEDAEPELKFIGETSHCMFEFRLTAHDGACPVKKDAPKPDVPTGLPFACSDRLYHPDKTRTDEYFEVYKLQGVYSPKTKTDKYDYSLGVCKAVNCPSSLPTGERPAGCQRWTEDGVPHAKALGDEDKISISPSLSGLEGYTMVFEGGDRCHSGVERSSIVAVVCDHSATTPQLTYIGETSHCVFEFELRAKEGACLVGGPPNPAPSPSPHPPRPPPSAGSSPCVDKYYPKENESEYFPVHAITRPEDKPYTTVGDVGSDRYSFEINVCGGVSCPGHENGETPAVCQTWEEGGHVHHRNLGTLESAEISPSVEGNNRAYTVTYADGEPCSNGDPRVTLVNIVCDPMAVEPRLVFVGEPFHCIYSFNLFVGESGCPLKDSGEEVVDPSADGSNGGSATPVVLWILAIVALVGGIAGTVLYSKRNPEFADRLRDVSECFKCCGRQDSYSYQRATAFDDDDF